MAEDRKNFALIKVMLWGTCIGVVEEIDNVCYFTYDEDFLAREHPIQVSPIVMPLRKQPYSFPELKGDKTFKGLPGLLAHSLPDSYGNEIIKAWLAKQGRDLASFTPLEKLAYVGKRGMGALEFLPESKIVTSSATLVEIENMVQLANDAVNKKMKEEDFDGRKMNDFIKVSTSAGGSRAKAIVAYSKAENHFKTGQVDAGPGYEYYLIKFDGIAHNKDKESEDSPYQVRFEYAYYLMALACGIDMSESFQFIAEGKYHFMTKRFDRYIDTNGKMQKIHMQSLCALAHLPYDRSHYYGYEEAVQVMRRLGLTQKEVEQFFRRMVFNVMARNQDDHVKNISFLMDREGKWRLSPAYDMTYAYDSSGEWTSTHQMLVNGKDKGITLDDLRASGAAMEIKPKKVEAIIEEVRSGVQRWKEFAAQASVPEREAALLATKFELV